MASKEEIEAGIDKVIQHWSPIKSTASDWTPLYGGISIAHDLLLFLNSQVVLIDEDRKLPKTRVIGNVNWRDGWNHAVARYKQANYKPVKSLVEECKDGSAV